MAYVTKPTYVPAATLFQPVMAGDALSAGLLTTAALSTTRQSYTNGTIVYWNTANSFNSQGQRWYANSTGNPSQGLQNRATSRNLIGATYFNHINECEFVFAGTSLDIQMWGSSSGFDAMVWVENGGRMQRVVPNPLGAKNSSMNYFNLQFADWYHGRIRIAIGAGSFVGVGCEQNALVKPAPDRLYGICDGDSYFEGQQAQNAGGTDRAYFVMNNHIQLFEATGIVWGNRAQSGTGFFNNASNVVNDDTWGYLASTRWFSADRKNWITPDFALPTKPLFFLLNGTWNDKDYTGGQSGMYTRAKACYQWVTAQDPLITVAHVQCEPYWGDASGGYGAAGTKTGPPTAGSVHDTNRLGQLQALNETPRCHSINPFGPDKPWWTGKGDSTTAVATDPTSQQAQLTGADHIHGNYVGFRHYSHHIARDLGKILVPLTRAQGQS